jgi:hypothetical protein
MLKLNSQPCGAGVTTPCGASGKIGDILTRIVVVPAAVGCGKVQVKDGAGAAEDVYAAGVNLTDLRTFTVDFGEGRASKAGGWSVVLGANVTAIALGKFQ